MGYWHGHPSGVLLVSWLHCTCHTCKMASTLLTQAQCSSLRGACHQQQALLLLLLLRLLTAAQPSLHGDALPTCQEASQAARPPLHVHGCSGQGSPAPAAASQQDNSTHAQHVSAFAPVAHASCSCQWQWHACTPNMQHSSPRRWGGAASRAGMSRPSLNDPGCNAPHQQPTTWLWASARQGSILQEQLSEPYAHPA